MKISDLWEDTGFFDREPMFIYDYYSFEIFDVNKAALEQYGFSKEEFLKKRFIDLGRKISIDDFPDIDKNKFNPSAIWIHQDKKKQEFFIQLTSHLINYRGKPTQLSVAHVVDHLFKKNKNLSLLPRIESVRAHVPMAMIEWDKKFNIRDWSDQANKIFGWDSESVRGKNLFDIGILPAEERNIYQANLENFISNGKNYYSSESESFTKKGEKIYCIWHNAAIYNVDRKLISMYSLVEDITDKRVAEKQLKESEHRFRVITEASLVGIFMIQGEKFKYVNPSFSRMTGYSTKELVHKKEPFQLIHEDDQSKLYELKSKWDTGEIESFDAELKAIKKQGEIIHVRVYGSKILLDEQPAVIGVVVDETDRIRTHQNYKESLESYKALFNSIHDAMYILDKDGKFIEVNQGAMDMYGFPKDKFIGNTPEILAAPGKVDMEQTNQFMKNVFEGSVEQFEWWGKKKNGEVFLKEVQLNPGTYFGKPVVIAIARDISDRYERDLEIRQNEELFRQLFQNAPVGIALLDSHKDVQLVNKAFENIFGFTKDEIKSISLDKVIVPEEKREEAAQLSASANAFGVSTYRMRKDGSLVDVLIYGVPVKVEEKIIGIYGIYVDITDQKRTEEKLRETNVLLNQIMSCTTDGIYVCDKELKYRFWNQAMEKMSGMKTEEATGKKPTELFPFLEEKGLWQHFLQASKGKTVKTRDYNYRLPGKSGEGWAQDRYTPLRNDKGKITGVLGTVTDITDRKEAEKKIRESLNEKEVLLSEIHHRVKNNLAVITGLLELQAQITENSEAREVLRDSQLRINSMALIHEKLYQNENLSKIQFGRYIKELTDIITKSHITKQKPVQLKIEAEPIEFTITQAIPCGLLMNEVVTNALKHAFEGRDKGEILISLKKAGNEIDLKITDDGVGLPDNFEELQANSLGMTLIYTLAKQLDGELTIESKKGTTFRIQFPYNKTEITF